MLLLEFFELLLGCYELLFGNLLGFLAHTEFTFELLELNCHI